MKSICHKCNYGTRNKVITLLSRDEMLAVKIKFGYDSTMSSFGFKKGHFNDEMWLLCGKEIKVESIRLDNIYNYRSREWAFAEWMVDSSKTRVSNNKELCSLVLDVANYVSIKSRCQGIVRVKHELKDINKCKHFSGGH